MKTEQILVIDDEVRIVESISFYLQKEGYKALTAICGADALKLFKQEKFDLVLLDIYMPEMDGFEVMERIFEINKDAVIVIITGNTSVESAVQALKIGAWDYLKKPFEYADLIKTVKNALSQKKNIADKKIMSAKLEASEKQYGYMVNNSPDLIFTLDQKGCFTFVNNQFDQVLGFSTDDLIGASFESIVIESDIEKAQDLILFGKDKCRLDKYKELHLKFKKAKIKTSKYDPDSLFAVMELRVAPIDLPATYGEKADSGVYVVARDITEKINLEMQLLHAQKMESIGTLAGGIAHDFNNILMGIMGYTSLVKLDFEIGSKEYQHLSSIDEYVNTGADMAKQLLGFSQKTSCPANPINLNYLFKISADMFGRTKKDIIIEKYLYKDLWSTIVDEGQIKQVLINLFINAWHAMPNGGTITIKSENIVVDRLNIKNLGLEKTGMFIKVTVSDTGTGMDDELITRIFDPFFSTKEKTQGTGLGLATSYGIIKNHNGIINVESKIGAGSSFVIYLPAVAAKVKRYSRSEQKKNIYNGNSTILLVDDEEGVIDVCSAMLQNLGYKVKAVNDGVQAIDILKSNKFKIDLVVLDMIMPKMSGRQTYKKIKVLDPDMKVLVCSGYSSDDEIQTMLEQGCADYIFKPFDVATLSEKVNNVLKIA